jgi:endonuclease/exonuclease/phosphatase family metal-dependent hydrolase
VPTSITDPPPPDVVTELGTLSDALDQVVPKKKAGNLLIATWNIRGFDHVTPKWRSVAGDSPIRDLSNVLCIAEIVSRFDVVAVQEVRRSAEAFLAMMRVLGEGWAFVVTDITHGDEGNNERLAFVIDWERVRPSGLACELVVTAEDVVGISEDALVSQFARTPYAVSFATEDQAFTLVTLHVTWGGSRLTELKAIAKWLGGWAKGREPWGLNLIALGDFNIDRQGDPLYQAFTETGLRPPDPHNYIPRTVFDDPLDPPNMLHFYDQIAWFTGSSGVPALSLEYRNAGMFFAGDLIPARDKRQLSFRISDHFPLWVEFGT